jgi:hypothetical protein
LVAVAVVQYLQVHEMVVQVVGLVLMLLLAVVVLAFRVKEIMVEAQHLVQQVQAVAVVHLQ